jgi:hypothetical protein
MTVMMKSLLAIMAETLGEAQAFGNHWSKMFQPLGFLSHNLISVQADMMDGAKGCEKRYISWTIFSSTDHMFLVSSG